MPFIQTYNSIVNQFRLLNNFHEIRVTNRPIQWPNGRGVYVIWRISDADINNLIYIGKTGLIKRNNQGETILGNGNFQNRIHRWTPYKFCETENCNDFIYSLRYGPTYGASQRDNQFNADAYNNSIPYEELLIHCFAIDLTHLEFTPALLEIKLLTLYLKEMNNASLPPANNEL